MVVEAMLDKLVASGVFTDAINRALGVTLKAFRRAAMTVNGKPQEAVSA